MNLLKMVLNNWKLALGGGMILTLLFMSGLALYYKSKADIKTEQAEILQIEKEKIKAAFDNKEKETNQAIEALTKDRDKAVAREKLISTQKRKALSEDHANDNLSPDFDVFFDELYLAENANDNQLIHQAPR